MPAEDPDSPTNISDATDASRRPSPQIPPTRDAKADAEQAIDDLDELLSGASFEDPVVKEESALPRRAAPPSPSRRFDPSDLPASSIDLPQFDKILQEAQVSGIDLLRDVNLEVKIELGRSRMLVENVLKLVEGSVVELDKLAGDPVDVYVNDRLVARGEVLVLNDNFCVRVNEIVQTSREEDL